MRLCQTVFAFSKWKSFSQTKHISSLLCLQNKYGSNILPSQVYSMWAHAYGDCLVGKIFKIFQKMSKLAAFKFIFMISTHDWNATNFSNNFSENTFAIQNDQKIIKNWRARIPFCQIELRTLSFQSCNS